MSETKPEMPTRPVTLPLTIIEQAEGLFEHARGAVSEAFTATVDAVRANPRTAAGIAAGAAAAVAGAAFGASKLFAKEDPVDPTD